MLHPERLLRDQAFQIGARVGFDRRDGLRTELAQHVRVAAFQRTEFEHVAAGHAAFHSHLH